jgi:hypothetical protein
VNAGWAYKWTQRQENLVDDKFYHENGKTIRAEMNAAVNAKSKYFLFIW